MKGRLTVLQMVLPFSEFFKSDFNDIYIYICTGLLSRLRSTCSSHMTHMTHEGSMCIISWCVSRELPQRCLAKSLTFR